MSVKVVDASAIAALLFGEPEAPTIATQLRNAKLAAPPLLQFEVASVCLKKLHRHPEQREALLATHQLFGRMAIVETRVDLPEAVTLAERMGLTVFALLRYYYQETACSSKTPFAEGQSLLVADDAAEQTLLEELESLQATDGWAP